MSFVGLEKLQTTDPMILLPAKTGKSLVISNEQLIENIRKFLTEIQHDMFLRIKKIIQEMSTIFHSFINSNYFIYNK